MLQRAKPYEIIKGYTVLVAVPEDIVGLKLQAIANDPQRASQDMADIEWLIKHHHKVPDKKLLEEYFNLFDRVPKIWRACIKRFDMLSDEEKREMLEDAHNAARGKAFAKARDRRLSQPMSWQEYFQFLQTIQDFFPRPQSSA